MGRSSGLGCLRHEGKASPMDLVCSDLAGSELCTVLKGKELGFPISSSNLPYTKEDQVGEEGL